MARRKFKAKMSAVRKVYTRQIAVVKKEEEEEAVAYRQDVLARKKEADALRVIRRQTRAAANLKAQEILQQARKLRDEMAATTHEMRLGQVEERRKAWLDALEADAATWITEDKIDTMITADLFSVKYSWQYARWFEITEKQRLLQEQARRESRPGQPTKEVPFSDDEYSRDWESEGEDMADEGAQAADLNAAADPTGKVARALAIARRASLSQGKPFPSPNYDDDGRALQTTDSESGPLSTVSRMRFLGVQPEELYYGKTIKQVLGEYEEWCRQEVEAHAAELPMPRVSLLSGSPAAPAVAATIASGGRVKPKVNAEDLPFPRDGEGRIILDDGEREVENAYIDFCVANNEVEALYYALLRKRNRLSASHPGAVATFDVTWAEWIKSVEKAMGIYDGPDDRPVNAGSATDAADPAVEAAAAKARDAAVSAAIDELFSSIPSAPAKTADDMDDRNIRLGMAMANSAELPSVPKDVQDSTNQRLQEHRNAPKPSESS